MDPRVFLNALVSIIMAGNKSAELTTAIVQKNVAGTQATANITLVITDADNNSTTQTISETFNL